MIRAWIRRPDRHRAVLFGTFAQTKAVNFGVMLHKTLTARPLNIHATRVPAPPIAARVPPKQLPAGVLP